MTRATILASSAALTALVVMASHRCPSRLPVMRIVVHQAPVDLRPVLREMMAEQEIVAMDIAKIESRCWLAPHRLTVAHKPPRIRK